MRRKRETRRIYHQVNIGLTQDEHAKLYEMSNVMGCSMSRLAALLIDTAYRIGIKKIKENEITLH